MTGYSKILSRSALALAATACLCARAAAAAAPDDAAREEELKAQMILSLPLAVIWPKPADDTAPNVRICTVAHDRVSAFIGATLTPDAPDKTVRLSVGVLPEKAKHCDVLYIGGTLTQVMEASKTVSAYPILTVSDAKGFAENGGMIELLSGGSTIALPSETQVTFVINLDRTRNAGLILDPLLLELAAHVVGQ